MDVYADFSWHTFIHMNLKYKKPTLAITNNYLKHHLLEDLNCFLVNQKPN